jgi:MoaA/NifB/PqqE/SkfB family radical SAM enzyme
MRKVSLTESLQVIRQGSLNWFAGRPIVVSFEVTDSCNCYCRHCDHGGPRDESKQLKAADYAEYMRVLKPCVVQISGGEPLLRDDLLEIIANIKQKNSLPYIMLVSNWALMTEERYVALHNAGIHQFSVSLDFPDRRHDDFRRCPGLFDHLDDLLPRCAKHGFDDIVMNTCIHSENVFEINAAAAKAREWGVNIAYSAYSARRTGCKELFITKPMDLATLRDEFAKLRLTRDHHNTIVTAESTIQATQEYFERGGAPGCRAGHRFLVVTADGHLQPCSMHFKQYGLHEHAKLVAEFTEHNKCDECYVAIRSNLDKSFPQILKENVANYFSFGAGGASNGNC